ncbi:MAG: fliE [Hyphomicrobiales bacterium]|nr:fliE [Hyphomicrobiales bacterium]
MLDGVSLSAALRAPGLDLAKTTAAPAASSGADFAQVLGSVASETVNNMRGGEAAAISGLRGQMPVQDVVEAVMSAERSLQTALALRDKTVAAFQEVTRMQI